MSELGQPITAQEVMGMDAVPCLYCLDREDDTWCPHCGDTGECRQTDCECWTDAAEAQAAIFDLWDW